MNPRLLPPAGLALVFLTLGSCGGGGGGGGGNTGALKLAGVNGTWSVAETVTSSKFEGSSGPGCETVNDTYTFFVNFENTTGSTIVSSDPQVVGSPTFTATASGRKISWKGTGADAGDSLNLTLDSSDTVMTGTAVEVDSSSGVACTTQYSVVATKVPTAPSISTGDWTFSYDEGGLGLVELGTMALTQKFASVSASNAIANIVLARVGGEWQGMVRADSRGLIGDVVGNFNAAGTEFTGTYDTGIGTFDLTGVKTSGGGSLCATIDTSAVWDLSLRPNGLPAVDFLNGTMTQTGCDVTCSFPAQGVFGAFTLGGTLSGQAWTASQGGAAGIPDRRFTGTFSGDPATALQGSFTNVSNTSDFGTMTLTKRTSSGACVTIDTSAVWDLVQTFNGGGSANYSGGTMTQNGCDVTFNYTGSTPFTFTGTVSGNTWTARQGGTNAVPNRRYTGTFSGTPATALSGTFTNVSNGNDFGTITMTKRTAPLCNQVNPGTWTIVFNTGILQGFTFAAGNMTQNSCTLQFAWSNTGQTATWSGNVTAASWSADLIGGNLFVGLGYSNCSLQANILSSPATTFTGNYSLSGNGGGGGAFTATRN